MSASKRTRPVTIEQASVSQSGNYNEPEKTWSTWGERWAAVKAVRGGEPFEGQRYSGSTVLFEFDYYDVDGVTDQMRVSFDSRYYDIKEIRPDFAQKRSTLIVCELVPQAAT